MSIKVLIIDDDPAITELIGLLLQSYGLQVLSANDSESGLQIIKNDLPDIVVLDLMMPGKDGWRICREVRTFSQVPIAILSAIDDPAMIVSALDAGADDYMVKPMSSDELLAHINNLTRRALVEKSRAENLIGSSDSFCFTQKPVQA